MRRFLVVALALTAVVAITTPATADPGEKRQYPNASHNPNGIQEARPAPPGSPSDDEVTTSADSLPFNYVIDIKIGLYGRTMQSANGKFCNYFTSDYAPGTDRIYITLRRASQAFAKVSFPTNGVRHYYCWGPGFSTTDYYYFHYEKANDGKQVTGHGTVRGY